MFIFGICNTNRVKVTHADSYGAERILALVGYSDISATRRMLPIMPGCLRATLKVTVTRATLMLCRELILLSTTLAAGSVGPLRSQVSLMLVTLG